MPGGVAGSDAVVQKAVRLILEGTSHPLVIAQRDALVANLPPRDKWAEARAIYDLAEEVIRYTDDPLPDDVYEFIDTIKSADWVLQQYHAAGMRTAADCVTQTILVGALARSLGTPVRLRVIGERLPLRYFHVHPELGLSGQWVAADVTATTASDAKTRAVAQLGYRAPAGIETYYEV